MKIAGLFSSFSRHYKTICGVVPGGMTPLLQGIDTHINKPLKSVLKNKYRDFMRNGEVEYTSVGNKKGPSYQLLVDWCSQAWAEFDTEIIKRSFSHTGVTNKGQVDPSDLHSKLRDLFGNITTVEELNKVMEENEDPSGLTDDESDESDDED